MHALRRSFRSFPDSYRDCGKYFELRRYYFLPGLLLKRKEPVETDPYH